MTEYVFDTKHDRYPVAVHVILTDGGGTVGSADGGWIVGSADGDGRVLLMRRAGSGYADGLLALPAGHVDLGETPTHCAIREVGEELGISLDPGELNPAGVMFRRSLEPRVDIFFTTSAWCGTPTIREPNKCTQLVWANPADLPDDTLDFVGQAITDARQGRHFHEYGWARAAG
ncbi:MAG: NUDIX domain-containing protein [Pseudonocardiales bacterium]|nr:NUDIX domain-containing protein [Pseudonocardiales bacterium]